MKERHDELTKARREVRDLGSGAQVDELALKEGAKEDTFTLRQEGNNRRAVKENLRSE